NLFLFFRTAEFLHRAEIAFRSIRHANDRAEIDKRGIETRCIAFRDKLRGISPKFFTAHRRIDRGAYVEQPCENTRTIRFDNWDRLIESKRCYGVRRIAATAW